MNTMMVFGGRPGRVQRSDSFSEALAEARLQVALGVAPWFVVINERGQRGDADYTWRVAQHFPATLPMEQHMRHGVSGCNPWETL